MKTDYFLGVSEEGFHKVAYTEWGEKSTTSLPLVCVHGLTRNKNDFDAIAQYLSMRGQHIFCPDIVGRGDSDRLHNSLHYTYEQYIADMNALIARINAPAINWLGTSMGGLIGMIMASVPRSPIRHLVLNDVGPQITTRALAKLSTYVGKRSDFASIDEAKTYYKIIYSDFGSLSDDEWLTFTRNSVHEIMPGKYRAKIDPAIEMVPAKGKIALKALLHPLKAMEGTLFDVDLWDFFRKVNCPVLVIHGQKSEILTPSIIEKMQLIYPQLEVIEVSDAGHAPLLLQPALQERILQWLMSA